MRYINTAYWINKAPVNTFPSFLIYFCFYVSTSTTTESSRLNIPSAYLFQFRLSNYILMTGYNCEKILHSFYKTKKMYFVFKIKIQNKRNTMRTIHQYKKQLLITKSTIVWNDDYYWPVFSNSNHFFWLTTDHIFNSMGICMYVIYVLILSVCVLIDKATILIFIFG